MCENIFVHLYLFTYILALLIQLYHVKIHPKMTHCSITKIGPGKP